ncbi:polysaccharide lyase 6 family protein [Caulobacter sp. RHG1]|uniref:polysaccharide lyase 6 family protein n=1 Tax=Caulobacter sp. (strain RHG1) TaxID=2545762 RepID=UPI001556356F|nr:polysaccharide lyase 6 family protein [Caulobacter sp. RHG1]NQE62707.1 Alginate lyase precursor [Caulobacter sp. RHG1]
MSKLGLKRSFIALVVAAAGGGVPSQVLAESALVRTPAEFASALPRLQPGDILTLADGEWRDFQIVFTGKGAADRPITLTAQTPGKVFLTGRSNLSMAGEHLMVSNLVFRDGFSPTGEVVSFRKSRTERANYSRVTGVVIDGFSKRDRTESDNWVALYGHHNRFDHNQLSGKTNAGTTLVVIRDPEQGLENRHAIDHNYFGRRPVLGSNGGETIRVGTSHASATSSFTTVENNWFEHCSGEVEIVSNKSGGNTYRGNVFFESEGAMVLRHGDDNLVENNVFIGNGKPNTGGVRVINRRNTVRNNYMEGLAGSNFGSALTIMYGVPNSPVHRYVQVDGAVIENNTLVDAREMSFGAGMDAERSAAPVNSRFAKNLIVNRDGHDPIRVQGDMSGIVFDGNVQSPAATKALPGVAGRRVTLERGKGELLLPKGLKDVGVRSDLTFIPREQTGVSWYPKTRPVAALDSGASQAVAPGEDTLTQAIAKVAPGGRVTLQPGVYIVNQVIGVDRAVTIQGPAKGRAEIQFSRPNLFEIGSGGALRLSHVTVTGALAPDIAGAAVIRAGQGAAQYQLIVEDSAFQDLTVNRSFNVFAAGPASVADRIRLERVTVERATGSVIAGHTETADLGTYNAEVVEVVDSVFRDVTGPVLDLYRGGTDESTFGPRLTLTGSTFERSGLGEAGALKLYGVQRTEARGNRFVDSGAPSFFRRVGYPVLVWSGNRFQGTPDLITNVTPLETTP